MQETMDSVSCTQKLIQPKRRVASAAVCRFRRAGSPASAGSGGCFSLLLPVPAAALAAAAAGARAGCCTYWEERVKGRTCAGRSSHV